jgi:FPC/CPF motif-containing protein YcgG
MKFFSSTKKCGFMLKLTNQKSREIPTSFSVDSWERHAFDAFRTRILLQDPQVFPCIYATKGFKANEHRCCFIEHLDWDPNLEAPNTSLDTLAAAFDEYARNWRQFGPLTSLVVLFPLSPNGGEDEASLKDDRKRFWDLLRAISDRDPQPWPEHILQDVEKPAWTLTFRGERFVGLALTPRYQNRQSRFCEGFVLAFCQIALSLSFFLSPSISETLYMVLSPSNIYYII